MKQETKIIIRQIVLSLVFLALYFVTDPFLNVIFFFLWFQTLRELLLGIRFKKRKYTSIVTYNISRFLACLLIVLTCYSIVRRIFQGIIVSHIIIDWLSSRLWVAFVINYLLDDTLRLGKWLDRRLKSNKASKS
ncbi:hypothetical protein SN4111_06480 [Ligilactobacillus agilis]|uniref:hypothetical protein n=1 Tax=Ligilactobacillus agilis TaxID=1601 RepID=UPI001437977C|nr:hypothetical protein [Ligilactobacillus agilis]GET14386.1 hypothetical protein SN4111_06480 [Ligilactobacillus agilis]